LEEKRAISARKKKEEHAGSYRKKKIVLNMRETTPEHDCQLGVPPSKGKSKVQAWEIWGGGGA